MTILNRGPGPFPELAYDAARYGTLADDLECIARGEHTDAEKLQDAPVLFEWKVFISPILHLMGIVMGHPKIADGYVCRTSELITFDPGRSYARTLSRSYRLGQRAEPGVDG